MTVTVIVNDFAKDRRSLTILEDKDFSTILRVWEQSDQVLEGKQRWCDLDTAHWRVLIGQNLSLVAALSDADYANGDTLTVQSLNFLFTGLVRSLEIRSDCMIELLRLDRTEGDKVAFNFIATLSMVQHPTNQSGLRLVIDNSPVVP